MLNKKLNDFSLNVKILQILSNINRVITKRKYFRFYVLCTLIYLGIDEAFNLYKNEKLPSRLRYLSKLGNYLLT